MTARTAHDVGAPVLVGVVGALAARSSLSLLQTRPPGGAALWSRTNHAGRRVTLLEGPAYVAASVAGALTAAALYGDPLGVPIAVAGVCGGALGALDDLAGDGSSKGLRGHLRALRHGRVTTGTVKILGLAATGLVTAALVDGSTAGSTAHRPPTSTVSTLAAGAVVAGTANLVNLLDLRPGRALKAVLLHALVAAWSGRIDPAVAAAAGAAVGCLPGDLAGRSMLGDTGANSAGAVLGCAVVARAGLSGRVAALAALAALTAASEKVSFTTVIESTPVLREIDALGR